MKHLYDMKEIYPVFMDTPWLPEVKIQVPCELEIMLFPAHTRGLITLRGDTGKNALRLLCEITQDIVQIQVDKLENIPWTTEHTVLSLYLPFVPKAVFVSQEHSAQTCETTGRT